MQQLGTVSNATTHTVWSMHDVLLSFQSVMIYELVNSFRLFLPLHKTESH